MHILQLHCISPQTASPRNKLTAASRALRSAEAPLNRDAKVRVMMVARALMHHQEKGKAYGKISAKALAGSSPRCSGASTTPRPASASPSYDAIAEAARCARSTVYEAIRALEQVGVPSWVKRIMSVREYVPRPVRQPGATTLREPGRRQRFDVA